MRSPGGSASLEARDLVGAEVLVVDKDPTVRAGIATLLDGGDLNVTAVADPAEAWSLLGQRFFSVVVLDLDTPEAGGGIEAAAAVALASPISAIIVLTPRRSFDDAVAAIRSGAVDVVVKAPDSVAYLRERIRKAAGRSLGRRRLRSTLSEVAEFHEEFLRRYMEADRRAHEQAEASRSRSPLGPDLTALLVSPDALLGRALARDGRSPFRVVQAHSGGEALDKSASEEIHLLMVTEELPDLPAATVIKTLRAGHPDCLIAVFTGPRAGARLEILEGERRIPVINNFDSSARLAGQLDELAEATRVRLRERHFIMGFRERNYELLRKLARLKRRLTTE